MSEFNRRDTEKQFEVYREFLHHVTENVTGTGIDEVTIADFDVCDKTAVHVECPLYYMNDLILDDLIVQLQQYPLYEYVRVQKDRNGKEFHVVYLAWNTVDPEPRARHPPRHVNKRPHILAPPAAWKAITSTFGLMCVGLFAMLKEPLFGLQ